MGEAIIYDISELMKEEHPEIKIATFSRLIKPSVKFYVMRVDRAVNEKEMQFVKMLLCNEEGRELLSIYFGGFVVEYIDGKFGMSLVPQIPVEKLYQLQKELGVEEDEVIVARKVEEKLFKLDKMKLSDLIQPFPEITDEMVRQYKLLCAQEDLEKAKKDIERKYGVVLG